MMKWSLRLVLYRMSLSVVEKDRLTVGHSSVIGLVDQNHFQILDIVHGLIENRHFGHFLDRSC